MKKLVDSQAIGPLVDILNSANISPDEKGIFDMAMDKSAHIRSKGLLVDTLEMPNWLQNKSALEIVIEQLNQPNQFLREICPQSVIPTLEKYRESLVIAVIGQTAPESKTKREYNQSAEKLKSYIDPGRTILTDIIGKEGVEQIQVKITQRQRLAQVQKYTHPQKIVESGNNNSSTNSDVYRKFLIQQLNKLAAMIDKKVALYGEQKSGVLQKDSKDMIDELYALDNLT